MGFLVDMYDKIKKYYKFTPSELRGFIIVVLVIAFVISFRDWGREQVDIASGLFNLMNAILIVGFTMLARDFAHKVGGLTVGFRLEYKMWTWGLLLAVVLAFVSNGRLWFLMPGGLIAHHLAGHRLGWFRYGLNYFALAMAALWGPLMNIVLIMIFRVVNSFLHNPLIEKLILLNVAFAIWSMIPIPPMDGSKIFYGSRLSFAFSFCGIVSAALLLYFIENVWIALLVALLIGLICWILYYNFIEDLIWQGPTSNMKR